MKRLRVVVLVALACRSKSAPAPPIEDAGRPVALASASATSQEPVPPTDRDASPDAGITCTPGPRGQTIVVTFGTDYDGWQNDDGTRVKDAFAGRVKIGKDEVVVFAEDKANCHSCRARVDGNELVFDCHGDMSSHSGSVRYDANAVVVEWVATHYPGQGATPERNVHAIPCGARVVLRSLSPDEHRVPHKCDG